MCWAKQLLVQNDCKLIKIIKSTSDYFLYLNLQAVMCYIADKSSASFYKSNLWVGKPSDGIFAWIRLSGLQDYWNLYHQLLGGAIQIQIQAVHQYQYKTEWP